MANSEVQQAISRVWEEIESLTGAPPEVTGGGRGWTASVEAEDGALSAKSTTKLQALVDLMNVVKANANEDEFDDGDMDEGEIAQCVAECVDSTSSYCRCKCGGRNHGLEASERQPVIRLGRKPCKCGCGEFTERQFVSGHDARYHAAQALEEYRVLHGLATTKDAQAHKTAALRKAAADRRRVARAAKKEVQAEVAVKAAEVAAAVATPARRSRRSKEAAGAVAVR